MTLDDDVLLLASTNGGKATTSHHHSHAWAMKEQKNESGRQLISR